MPKDVVGISVRARQRHDHAILERLGDASQALTQVTGECIRLLKIGVVGIQNDRLGPFELMLKYARESLVPPLSHTRRVLDRFALFRIEMDVVVRGLEDLEVERLILDLVPPEVLSGYGGRECTNGQGQEQHSEEAARGSRARRVRTSMKIHVIPLLAGAFACVQVTALPPGEPIHRAVPTRLPNPGTLGTGPWVPPVALYSAQSSLQDSCL